MPLGPAKALVDFAEDCQTPKKPKPFSSYKTPGEVFATYGIFGDITDIKQFSPSRFILVWFH